MGEKPTEFWISFESGKQTTVVPASWSIAENKFQALTFTCAVPKIKQDNILCHDYSNNTLQ